MKGCKVQLLTPLWKKHIWTVYSSNIVLSVVLKNKDWLVIGKTADLPHGLADFHNKPHFPLYSRSLIGIAFVIIHKLQ